MKFFFITLCALMMLTSCETNEENLNIEPETALRSYKISRDAQGKYSIDYEVNENVTVESVKNAESNANEFYLSKGKVAVENQLEIPLVLDNNVLEAKFYDETSVAKGFIIEDDEILLARGEENNEYLQSYSIESLEDGSYQVEFIVKEGVAVSYNYNEQEDIYEINLKEGIAKTLEHSVTYVKTGKELKIDFVNFYTETSAKSTAARRFVTQKPRQRFL